MGEKGLLKKYMSYKDFLKQQKFTEIFNLKDERHVRFIKDVLLRLKPREVPVLDLEGWVYVYYREID